MLRAELYKLKDSIRNHEVTLSSKLAPSRSLRNKMEKLGWVQIRGAKESPGQLECKNQAQRGNTCVSVM